MRDATVTVPRDAATVLLLREALEAPEGFEVFMVQRHPKSAFMAGVHVFPGGKVDDHDRAAVVLSRVVGCTIEEAAEALGENLPSHRLAGIYVAAIRETLEEAGVFLGTGIAQDQIPIVRRQLASNTSFERILEAQRANLALDRLVPWTRWITPEVEPRRYDTRFFLAKVQPEVEATHDDRETTGQGWFSPSAALEAADAGTIGLAPPTHRSLEMLSAARSLSDALDSARRKKPPLVRPVFGQDGEVPFLALPGDPAHPEGQAVIPGPTRFVLERGRWWSRHP
ncbi:MAG: NUDIX hydrolase [Myxococcales bacterium]|nr:NUDIX hydrolase [Myxococcales bacterium]